MSITPPDPETAKGFSAVDDSAAHVWDQWEPDLTPAPSGLFPLASVTSDLVGMGLLNQDLADRFVEGITTAGRDGRFWMSVTMTTVVARRPG